ncbi:hypothetical protein PS2_000222 [Malus domestica]
MMNRNVRESLAGGRNFPMGSQHRRGQNLNLAAKDSDDGGLDLFSKNRHTLSVTSSDESSDVSVKLGRLSVGSAKVGRTGIDDLLSSTDGGKHDYDWLLTPLETPLFSFIRWNGKMLEKIGLPAKPSLRRNTWVVDCSHCQGCSSQFTFINRKHHCRRCGGLFCNSCTQQRMLLRGQGDSPVRICDPCKKLEEAARFERYGPKGRAGRGSSKLTSNHDDEVLDEISPPPSDLKPQNSRINDKGICTAGGAFSGSISIFPRDLESSSGFPITPTRVIPPELPLCPTLPLPPPRLEIATMVVVYSPVYSHLPPLQR